MDLMRAVRAEQGRCVRWWHAEHRGAADDDIEQNKDTSEDHKHHVLCLDPIPVKRIAQVRRVSCSLHAHAYVS